MKKLFYLFFSLLLFFSLSLAISTKVNAVSVNTFQVTTDGSQQKDPIVYKDLVAYTNFGGTGGIDIWLYNLKTKQNSPIITKLGQQFLTSFYKGFIIYDDFDESTQRYSVRLYNMKTKEDTLIAGGSTSHSGGVTNGKYVIYLDSGACGQIHAYNLKKKTDEVISPGGCQPLRISDDVAIWGYGALGGSNIYGYDLQKKLPMDIVTDANFQESPNIFGDNVVYVEYTTGSIGDYQAIKMKNIRSGIKKTIYESTISAVQWPSISDKYVVWSEAPVAHVNSVKAADLKTGEVFELQAQGPHQNSHTTTSIWKDTAAWMSWRTGNGDIYAANIHK